MKINSGRNYVPVPFLVFVKMSLSKPWIMDMCTGFEGKDADCFVNRYVGHGSSPVLVLIFICECLFNGINEGLLVSF